jgi:hypothetical protein
LGQRRWNIGGALPGCIFLVGIALVLVAGCGGKSQSEEEAAEVAALIEKKMSLLKEGVQLSEAAVKELSQAERCIYVTACFNAHTRRGEMLEKLSKEKNRQFWAIEHRLSHQYTQGVRSEGREMVP